MMEGDAKGRVFTFPIPTINITKDFEWDSPVIETLHGDHREIRHPLFLQLHQFRPEPRKTRMSMCCRLRLDTCELRKRGGGLFGSNPLTGFRRRRHRQPARLAYLSQSESEFFAKLRETIYVAKKSLEIKRKVVEEQTAHGPLSIQRQLSARREGEERFLSGSTISTRSASSA
ncbi:MAG: hypothetical protein MZU79_01570 [Anaerotruncus sp.]|nr:hypothetical protein [Anaerotruncus sp.]